MAACETYRPILMLQLVCLLCMLMFGDALRCYQCQNVHTESKKSSLSTFLAQNDQPSCLNPSEGDVRAVTCPNDYGYKCGLIEGTITGKILFSDVSLTFTTRDCLPTTDSDGCYTADRDQLDVLNTMLHLMTGVEVDGKVCYCSDSYCVAGCKFWIGSVCFPDWSVYAVGVVGAILTLLILSGCCCCCCCRPCRSKSTGHIVAPPQQTVTYLTSTQGTVGQSTIGSCSNPLYPENQVY